MLSFHVLAHLRVTTDTLLPAGNDKWQKVGTRSKLAELDQLHDHDTAVYADARYATRSNAG